MKRNKGEMQWKNEAAADRWDQENTQGRSCEMKREVRRNKKGNDES